MNNLKTFENDTSFGFREEEDMIIFDLQDGTLYFIAAAYAEAGEASIDLSSDQTKKLYEKMKEYYERK